MRPVIRQSSAEKIFRYFFEETWKKYPVIILGVRKKKINLFDDENYTWNAPLNQFKTFNWNADPSAFRIGGVEIAILRTGVHFYKISYHHIGDNSKRYVALRPATPGNQLPVWRTNAQGKLYSSIGTALNHHAGGDRTTGSRGCQTAPRAQYSEYIQFVGSAYGLKIPLGIQRRAEERYMKGIGNIPYILVTQEQFNYIVNLPGSEFDSAADLKYQAANFVGIPKIERFVPQLQPQNAAAAAVVSNLEAQQNQEILATKEIFPENISEQIDNLTNSAAVPALVPPGNPTEDSFESSNKIQNSGENPNNFGQPSKQDICKERPSTFVRIGALITGFVGTITTFGINLSSVIQNKLEEISTTQIFYGLLGIGLVALAIWFYDRSANRANRLNQAKLGIAANPALITTELNANKRI